MSQTSVLDLFLSWVVESGNMAVAMAPWLLFGFAVSGLLHSFMPVGWIRRHLAKDGLAGIVKAALVGAPLPICSCGVIPVARWLRKEGASRGSTVSFLVATPETGVDSIVATMAMMGGVFAGVRPAVAVVAGIFAGVLVARFARDHEPLPVAPACTDGCCADTPDGEVPNNLKVRAKGFVPRLVEAMHYGFVELVEDVAKWLLLGLLVGGAITAFVPNDFLAGAGKWGLAGSYLVMLGVGIPLYVCATGSIPIAAALIAKGVSPGAALVFLLVGPATNVATIAFVGGTFGRRAVALYLASIASVAVVAGLIFDVLVPGFTLPHAHHQHGAESFAFWEILLGAALILLLLPALFRWLRTKFTHSAPQEKTMPNMLYHIPAMTCGNCARHVEKAAKKVPGVASVQVDIAAKTARFEGVFDPKALESVLSEEGYPPRMLH